MTLLLRCVFQEEYKAAAVFLTSAMVDHEVPIDGSASPSKRVELVRIANP